MASGPAAGRSASTQRSTVAGDAKPIVTMIECEAGHTRPDARAARATNSTDQQCPTARAVTSPGQSRIEAITPLGDKPIGAEPDTHMAHTGRYGFPQPNLLRTQQVKHQGSPPPVDVTHDAQLCAGVFRPPRYGAGGPCHRADAAPGWRIEHIRQAPSSSARLCEPRDLCTTRRW